MDAPLISPLQENVLQQLKQERVEALYISENHQLIKKRIPGIVKIHGKSKQ